MLPDVRRTLGDDQLRGDTCGQCAFVEVERVVDHDLFAADFEVDRGESGQVSEDG